MTFGIAQTSGRRSGWRESQVHGLLRLEWDVDPKRHVMLAEAFQSLPASGWKTELARRAGAIRQGRGAALCSRLQHLVL